MENKCGAAERTRKNLIRAFWQCYEEKPFTEVTAKSVTQIAGYNRSTFYQYFDNVSDLHFLGRLKKFLCVLSERRWNMEEATLLSEFTSAVIVSAVAYLSSHPNLDRTHIIHMLHSYIHGGAMSLLALH